MLKALKKYIYQKPETLVYVYFGISASLLAIFLQLGVGPDEQIHMGIIDYYANHSFDPFLAQQVDSFSLGDLTREVSYLYHYILSLIYRLFHLFVDPRTTLLMLRFTSVAFGIGTLVCLGKLGRMMGLAKLPNTALVAVIANMPAFLFLSATINYDTLVVFLASALILNTMYLVRHKSINSAYVIVLISLLGPLVKFSFLPISAVAILVLFWVVATNKRTMISHFRRLQQWKPVILYLAIATMIISGGLFLERYAVNFAKYGRIKPDCSQILSQSQCRENYVYNRTVIYDEANLPAPTTPFDVYVVSWYRVMVERTYGLLGHREFKLNSAVITSAILAGYLLIGLSIRRLFSPLHRKMPDDAVIPIISIIYIVALMLTNLEIYNYSQEIGLAVQGRYWLPVLGPFIIYVGCLYKNTLNSESTLVRIGLGVLIIFAFAFGMPNILQGIAGMNWV